MLWCLACCLYFLRFNSGDFLSYEPPALQIWIPRSSRGIDDILSFRRFCAWTRKIIRNLGRCHGWGEQRKIRGWIKIVCWIASSLVLPSMTADWIASSLVLLAMTNMHEARDDVRSFTGIQNAMRSAIWFILLPIQNNTEPKLSGIQKQNSRMRGNNKRILKKNQNEIT